MKTNCWLILGTMLATTAVAQVNTNKLPEIPPPALNAPAAPPSIVTPVDVKTNTPVKKVVHKKSTGTKKVKTSTKTAKDHVAKDHATTVAPLLPVTLVPGPATVAAEHVNLRGQAGLKGEVVGHVQKGDTVTVISEINLDKPKAGEPAQWAKVALPSGTKVWVDSKYIDATNNVVTAKKLNLRGGPGENYSVIGVIEKGAAISAVTTKGDWTQIQTPASAFAFVAASYLKQDGSIIDTNTPAIVAANPNPNPTPEVVPTPMPTPTPVTVAPAPVITPTPTTVAVAPPVTPVAPPVTPTPEPVVTPAPAPVTPVTPTPTLATDTDTNLPPPPPRIVTHEGTVRASVSLVAPTYFELYDPANDKAIDYLYTTSTNLNLSRYSGLHITVTGEEAMDVRWKDTPVLTIQKIYVLSADKPKATTPTKHSWFSK